MQLSSKNINIIKKIQLFDYKVIESNKLQVGRRDWWGSGEKKPAKKTPNLPRSDNHLETVFEHCDNIWSEIFLLLLENIFSSMKVKNSQLKYSQTN